MVLGMLLVRMSPCVACASVTLRCLCACVSPCVARTSQPTSPAPMSPYAACVFVRFKGSSLPTPSSPSGRGFPSRNIPFPWVWTGRRDQLERPRYPDMVSNVAQYIIHVGIRWPPTCLPDARRRPQNGSKWPCPATCMERWGHGPPGVLHTSPFHKETCKNSQRQKKHPSQTSEDLASPPPRAPVFNVHMHARPAVCKSGRLFRNGSHSPGSTAPNFEIGARGCHRFDARSRSAFLFSETTVPPTPVGLLGAPKDSRSTPRRFARYTHRRDKSANVRMHRGRAPARV